METTNFSNLDGEVINYDAVSAQENVTSNLNEGFMSADGESDDYYNAGGLFSGVKKRMNDRHKARMAKKASRTNIRNAKASKKAAVGQSKLNLSKAQQTAAKAASNTTADVALAKAISGSSPSSKKSGLSTGAKIGIGVGVAALLGVIAFIIIKKRKK